MGHIPPSTSIQALADFRHLLRQFLVQSDKDALEVDLEPQQYLLLLYLFARPDDQETDTKYVAERLVIKHNSAVELVDRACSGGLIKRLDSRADHRRKLLRLTAKGRRVISKLVEVRLRELKQSGPVIIHSLEHVLRVLKRP